MAGALPIDRTFVEEWSERYRCGAQNSRWRPGPKFRAAMGRYPELEALDGITDYWDLEQHIFDAVGGAVRSARSCTIPHFVTVGYWKARRQLARYLTNTGEALEAVTLSMAKLRSPLVAT